MRCVRDQNGAAVGDRLCKDRRGAVRYGRRKEVLIIKAKDILREELNKIHESGVVHFDLKPENILVQTNDKGEIKIAITDISGTDKDEKILARDITSTSGYASPEYFEKGFPKGSNKKAHDIFSLMPLLPDLI